MHNDDASASERAGLAASAHNGLSGSAGGGTAQGTPMAIKYPIDASTREDLKRRFTYHSPKDDQPQRYEFLRDQAHQLAQRIVMLCPKNREQSLALTHLENAIFYANAAIARGE